MALSQDRAPQSLMSNHDVPSKWFKMAIGTGFAKATLVNQLGQLFPRNVLLCNAKTSSIHRICWDFTSQEDLCSAWSSKVGMACYGIWRFPKFWEPQNDKMDGSILLKWMMIWGYSHFRKPPYLDIAKSLNIATLTNKNEDFIWFSRWDIGI